MALSAYLPSNAWGSGDGVCLRKLSVYNNMAFHAFLVGSGWSTYIRWVNHTGEWTKNELFLLIASYKTYFLHGVISHLVSLVLIAWLWRITQATYLSETVQHHSTIKFRQLKWLFKMQKVLDYPVILHIYDVFSPLFHHYLMNCWYYKQYKMSQNVAFAGSNRWQNRAFYNRPKIAEVFFI